MDESAIQRPVAAHHSGALKGRAVVPGDKSISHRALILGSLAVGESRISGLLEAGDRSSKRPHPVGRGLGTLE